MARGVNKVILVGNLGQDPEVRYTQNQKQVANLSVATSDQWTDKATGQKQERTEWHRVVLFDRLAEIAGQYLRKGSKVYLEGKLQTRKWQNQQGVDQYTTEIVANELQMLDSRPEGGGYANANQNMNQAPAQQQPAYQAPAGAPQAAPQPMGGAPAQAPSGYPAAGMAGAAAAAYPQGGYPGQPQSPHQPQPGQPPQQPQQAQGGKPFSDVGGGIDDDIPF